MLKSSTYLNKIHCVKSLNKNYAKNSTPLKSSDSEYCMSCCSTFISSSAII